MKTITYNSFKYHFKISLKVACYTLTFLSSQKQSRRTGRRPSLMKIIWKLSWKLLVISGFLTILGEGLRLLVPYVISGIIDFVEGPGEHTDQVCLWGGGEGGKGVGTLGEDCGVGCPGEGYLVYGDVPL